MNKNSRSTKTNPNFLEIQIFKKKKKYSANKHCYERSIAIISRVKLKEKYWKIIVKIKSRNFLKTKKTSRQSISEYYFFFFVKVCSREKMFFCSSRAKTCIDFCRNSYLSWFSIGRLWKRNEEFKKLYEAWNLFATIAASAPILCEWFLVKNSVFYSRYNRHGQYISEIRFVNETSEKIMKARGEQININPEFVPTSLNHLCVNRNNSRKCDRVLNMRFLYVLSE